MLLSKKVKILTKYLDFSDVFLEEKTLVLSKTTKLNQHTIELFKDQQLFYRLNHSLPLVKLKTLKIYIQTKLINGFTWPLKSLGNIIIFFTKKSIRNL